MLKSPKTIKEQIFILEKRGIIIDDYDLLAHILINNNYYRLMGYAYQFKTDKGDYKNNTKFSTILGIYNFDKSLRQIIFPLVELLEVSFRAKLAYFMCNKYGSEFYLDINIFQNTQRYFNFINIIKRCIRQSGSELFVKHHLKKYKGRFPFWVLTEVLSLSNISKFFKNINTRDKKEFSRAYYQYNAEIFENWLHHFTVIRNICAHYGRIYNKNILPTVKLLKEDGINRTMKIFDSIFILRKVINDELIWKDFVEKLDLLINDSKKNIDLKLIGFPRDYIKKLKY